MAEVKGYYFGLGRRKRAVAKVRLYPSLEPTFVVNESQGTVSPVLKRLLDLVSASKKFSVSVKVEGGGINSQEEAIILGLARAFLAFDPDLRSSLRKEGYLTRDRREKERKKYGLKRARRAVQFSKR